MRRWSRARACTTGANKTVRNKKLCLIFIHAGNGSITPDDCFYLTIKVAEKSDPQIIITSLFSKVINLKNKIKAN